MSPSLTTSPAAVTNKNDLPVLSGNEARSIDLNVTEKLGRVRVLECVATRLADAIEYHLPIGDKETSKLLFVAGKGNNGANAIACARILYLRGWKSVKLVPLVDPGAEHGGVNLRPNIAEQLELFQHFVGASTMFPLDLDKIKNHDGVIIDGVLGTGIDQPPRGISKDAIEAITSAQSTNNNNNHNNASNACVLSVDIPSGLNHVTGTAPGVCVRATWTVNLHMFKSGQLEDAAKEYVGELWSVESALGYITFPGNVLADKFKRFYKDGPIRKAF